MILSIAMALGLAATAEFDAGHGYCAFPTAASGGAMLPLRVEAQTRGTRRGATRVWLVIGRQGRIPGEAISPAQEGAPALLIRGEEVKGELTLALRADGRATLHLRPEGAEETIKRAGRCGGISPLLADLRARQRAAASPAD